MNFDARQGTDMLNIWRLLFGIAAVLACGLTFAIGTASAEVQRSLVATFGPDGTTGTFFRDTQRLGFHQVTNRVYVMPMFPGGGPGTEEAQGLYGFDIPSPGTFTPRGAPFPLPIPGAAYVGGFTVDNSNTPTSGRLYQPIGGFASQTKLSAWESDGTEVGIPFPLTPGPGSYPNGPNGRYCEAAVHPDGTVFVADFDAHKVRRYTYQGVPLASVETDEFQPSSVCALAFDSEANLFVESQNNGMWKYTASSNYTEAEPFIQGGGGQITIDKATDRLFTLKGNQLGEYDDQGHLLREFGNTLGSANANFTGVAVDETTNEVYAADQNGRQVRVFGPPKTLPKLTTNRPTDVTTTSAIVYGHVDLDGGPPVTECFFEYGPDLGYTDGTVPCTPEASVGEPFTGETDVSAALTELSPGTRYNYRLVAKTSEGAGVGKNETFIAADPPLVRNQRIIEVTADHALLKAEINPRGVNGSWRIEYGAEDCAVSECESSDSENFVLCSLFGCPSPPNTFVEVSKELINLTPGQLHHFRFAGDNDQAGTGYGEDGTFRTFPLDPAGVDPCPNSHERKLSGAAKLSHCRGYELVSAADAGGYDVASNIVEGETPLPAFPQADDRFLYTTSVGKLPGVAGFPVNHGTDPYVAVRGSGGWETRYMGLPATLPSDSPFASTVSGADDVLATYAFGGPEQCSPCFDDGTTGIPLRLPNGDVVQGMEGSIDVAEPESAGEVDKPVSADGSHFVFGSEQKFEPAGNAGSPTLYNRDLSTETTEVVSTMPDGSTIAGDVAELDISGDGSRVLVGRPVGIDAQGNPYYDLYMHIGGTPDSVLVADTPNGVLYNGMSADGTKVYFTTAEQLADDADASPDIFRADVGTSSAAVARVSTGSGGTGQTDACTPPDDWNVAEGGPNCGALAFAGGAGVASGDGTLFFISPERLDGEANGLQNEPNLYIAQPGSAPHYVGLLDNSQIKPPPSPPKRPIQTTTFGGSLSGPRALAVNEITGDVYVVEANQGRISRFTAEGNPHLFTAGPGAGTNKIGGLGTGGGTETGIGVDGSPGSPFQGYFYTRQNTGTVNVYAPTGEQVGELTGFGETCGLAVDQATGDVYIGDYNIPGVRKYHLTSTSTPVSNANYEITSIVTQGLSPCQVAAGGGYVYASAWSEGPLRRYPMSEFAASPPSLLGTQVSSQARYMYVDPSSGEVYVSKGSRISVYTSDENEEVPVAEVGLGTLNNQSFGVAVNGKTHHVFAQKQNNIVHFGYEEIPYILIDHPGVLHAKEQADVRSSEDIQVTADGDDAVFTSKIVITGKPTDGNAQVYRYHVPTDDLQCVSCTPTSAITTGDAFLTPNGTNLDETGRVYFTSPEQLTLRDTNRRTDAYEWDEGNLNLVSTGTGTINAALASVDAQGKNAYFFTRESIIPQDDNGPAMKVYTAREFGGYSYLPDEVPCQAADECRGAGTKVAPPPPIGTYEGSGGNVRQAKKRKACRKGFVRQRRRCVKRKKSHSKRKRAHRHSRAAHNQARHRHG
jgi:hypothetical protein